MGSDLRIDVVKAMPDQPLNATLPGLGATNTSAGVNQTLDVLPGQGLEPVTTVLAGSMNPFTALGVMSARVVLDPSNVSLSCSFDVQVIIRCQEVKLKLKFKSI